MLKRLFPYFTGAGIVLLVPPPTFNAGDVLVVAFMGASLAAGLAVAGLLFVGRPRGL